MAGSDAGLVSVEKHSRRKQARLFPVKDERTKVL